MTVEKLFELAESGLADAQYTAGRLLHYGQNGVKKDLKRAASLYQKAAENGHIPAQYAFASYLSYYCGDHEASVFWHTKAAQSGYLKSQMALAELYLRRSKSPELFDAVYWLTKAAEGGHSRAQYILGMCLTSGIGTEQDLIQGVYWYDKAAQQGDPMGLYYLGCSYFYGQGVEQDTAKGISLLEKAASQNCEYSMVKLGEIYYDGEENIQANLELAIMWVRKAISAGSEDADYFYDKICKDKGIPNEDLEDDE